MTVRLSQSTPMEMSSGGSMHPCLTPVSTLKGSVIWLLCMTRQSMFSYKAWMMFSNFCGISWCRRMFHSYGRCRPSRSFSESTNTTYKDLLHSCDCSRIWCRTKMWSMLYFPFLKPACSWHSSLSTAVMLFWRMSLHILSFVSSR